MTHAGQECQLNGSGDLAAEYRDYQTVIGVCADGVECIQIALWQWIRRLFTQCPQWIIGEQFNDGRQVFPVGVPEKRRFRWVGHWVTAYLTGPGCEASL